MGWRLVREVLYHCPDLRYREFRVFVALALDARDETRQGMPGTETLILMSNCGRRQTLQAVAGLKTRGLIKTVRRAAPGVRAVYEILPLCTGDCPNECGHVRTRSSADSAPTSADFGGTSAAMSAHTQSLSSSHNTQSSLGRTLGDALPHLDDEEIKLILEGINRDPQIKQPAKWLARVIANGDAVTATRRYLKVRPNGQHRAGRRTNACKSGSHYECGLDWCTCTCHARTRPQLDDPAPLGEQP